MKKFAIVALALVIAACGEAVTESPTDPGAGLVADAPAERVSASSSALGQQVAAKIGPGVREAIQQDGAAQVMIALAGADRAVQVRSARDLPALERAVAAAQSEVLSRLQSGEFTVAHRYAMVPALAGAIRSDAALNRLASSPAVQRIDLELDGSGSLATSVPQINADQRHTLGNLGAGLVVGVLDSGIDSDHPDLADDVGPQACFGDNNGSLDGVGFCPNGSDRQTGAGAAEDDHGHGTHVSSIISSNGTTASVGVAPGATIVGVKVLDSNNSFWATSEVIAGLNWIITNNSAGLNLGVQVINMSLGTSARFTSPCDNANATAIAMASAVNTLRGMGVLSVVASGNSGSGTQLPIPACVANTSSVGAVDATDNVAGFANSDGTTDVFAPGVSIVASGFGGGTLTLSGTSMAAPHVTGCVALLIESGDATTANAIETRLETSTVQVTDATNGLTFPRLDCAPDAAPSVGGITIRKVTVPVGRTGFTFSQDIDASGSFTLNDAGSKTFTGVTPGTYTVSELSAPFFDVSLTCSEDGPANSNTTTPGTASITLEAAETVDCTFTNSDKAPDVTVTGGGQTVQYSDYVANITVTAMDSDQDVLSASFSYSVNGGAVTAGLPLGLTAVPGACSVAAGVQTCTWTISGAAGIATGAYTIHSTVTDDDGTTVVKDVALTIQAEDASISFDAGNPVGVEVTAPGGNSGPFSLTVHVKEAEPDQPTASAAPGDLSKAVVSLTLTPIAAGGAAAGACTPSGLTGTGYGQVLTVVCTFDDVPVNVYSTDVTVTGGYYSGAADDVVTVFDPSLGFTSGGGWFYWPGTNERTNFGYTMKYNRNATRLQGSLLMIRHLPDGTKYRVKSNALYGLALGEGGSFQWASFNGKATYQEPGWLEPMGNHEFVVYVEDHGEPGTDVDRFWIEVQDKDGAVVPVSSMAGPASSGAQFLRGGNILVPHQNGKKASR
jgi:subtilisin family serine protease